MLTFPAAIRIYVALEPVDMRRQYDGLWAAAQQQLGENPKQGALFCFTNRERTRLKLLCWGGTGVWVLEKRLEQGRFSWPEASESTRKLALTPEALAVLIGGVETRRGSLKPWYERE